MHTLSFIITSGFMKQLDYKKPMNVYRESILINDQKNEAA